MRAKTIICEKADDFDIAINDFMILAASQGCTIEYVQVTHLEKENRATILYLPHVPEGDRAPEFLEVDKSKLTEKYPDIDSYEKY